MFVVVVLALAVAAAAGQKYTTKFDNVDVDQIIKNERLLKSYFECVMERDTCTPDGEELKKNIPDALENECAKCSEKQKSGVEKILKHIFEQKQAMYKELEEKYDSEGKYRAKYKALAEEKGVKVD